MKKAIAKYFYIGLFSLLANYFAMGLCAQNTTGIRGLVEDTQGKPLQFATAKLSVDGTELASKTTNANGIFEFSTEFLVFDSVRLDISHVNKAAQTLVLKKADYASVRKVVLLNLSLTLNDVVVTGTIRNQNSASSIVFGEEAIRQLQAFSLADVINSLPGKKTEPPNLQSPQTVTLRTASGGANGVNNSFGIAIFIDGIRISNETDMQSRGLSSRGFGGSQLNAQGSGSSDVTYNGFDLRDIPMSNIASIEIIQGIGSSRYGDFTNGAILITTKAGRTPYSFNTNFNGGSTSFSLSKGVDLKRKAGALNFSIGYTNSNDDPRDKLKTYNNINGSLRWTKNLGENITNSFSANFSSNFDDVKQDPDNDARVMAYSKRKNFRFSNMTNIDFRNKFFNNLSVALNYSRGVQSSYAQLLLNGPPKGIGYKDTTGVYEGYFLPGQYLAVEEVDGKPISYSVNIDVQSRYFTTFNLTHRLSVGAAFNASGNKGRGNVVDPNTPRWVNQAGQNERSFSYLDSVKFDNNLAFYLQDNIKGELFNKRFNLGLGLRLNTQNERLMPQPRLAFNYYIHKNINLSTSYGITYKSPSLAHLYPAPTYFDIPLLNLYTGYAKSSLYLVYTHKELAQNQQLKNAVTYQLEQGISYSNIELGSASLFAYYKKNKNGFNPFSEFIPTSVPVYDYRVASDSSINYFPTGETGRVLNLKRTRMNNGLNSEDYGVQLSIQSRVIRALSTSFSISGGYTVSHYKDGNFTAMELASDNAFAKHGAVYITYLTRQKVSRNSVVNFGSNTHIPQIGFVVSVIADYQPLLGERWDAQNIYPLGYTLANETYIGLTTAQAMSNEFIDLRKNAGTDDAERNIIPSKGFWTFNMRVAKEIDKKIRLSVSAFNVINRKPKAYSISNDGGGNTVGLYNYKPLSITIGASLQF